MCRTSARGMLCGRGDRDVRLCIRSGRPFAGRDAGCRFGSAGSRETPKAKAANVRLVVPARVGAATAGAIAFATLRGDGAPELYTMDSRGAHVRRLTVSSRTGPLPHGAEKYVRSSQPQHPRRRSGPRLVAGRPSPGRDHAERPAPVRRPWASGPAAYALCRRRTCLVAGWKTDRVYPTFHGLHDSAGRHRSSEAWRRLAHRSCSKHVGDNPARRRSSSRVPTDPVMSDWRAGTTRHGHPTGSRSRSFATSRRGIPRSSS